MDTQYPVRSIGAASLGDGDGPACAPPRPCPKAGTVSKTAAATTGIRAARFPRISYFIYRTTPDHFQPSDGRLMERMRILWSAGLRPGLPLTMTWSPGLRVSLDTPSRLNWPPPPHS